MRLNIGCGKKVREGWTNIDITDNGQEIVSDIREIPLDDNSAYEAEAIHVLEHFNVWEAEPLLREWFRVLMPGGVLRIECPDMTKILTAIRKFKDEEALETDAFLAWLYGALYGDFVLEDKFMTHCWTFRQSDVAGLMSNVGFGYVVSVAPVYHRPQRDMAIVGIKP